MVRPCRISSGRRPTPGRWTCPGAGDGRGSEGGLRSSRHGDEPRRRPPTCSSSGSCGTTRPIPRWLGRDRFVLSCGHSSLTSYIQLYLSGYGLTLDDLKALRTWGSITPGHPEHGLTPGVETTTGPLGQGLANAVGMAMAARRERGLLDPDAARRDEPVRPPHLRLRLRRRHRGGRQPRGVVAGRASAARQPDPALRRQPHLDRGRHRDRQVRGRAGQVRGLRLAHPAGRLAHPGRLPRGRGGAVPGADHAPGTTPQAPSIIALSTIIGWPAPEQAEHRRGARLGARRVRGGRHQGDPRLRPGRDLPGRGRGGRPGPRGRRPRQARQGPVGGALRQVGGGQPVQAGPARPARRAGAAGRLGGRAAGVRASPTGRWRPGRHRARC